MKIKINQLKAGVILSYINMIVMFISSLVITPFMIKALGQDEYGLYQLIGSFAGYLSIMEFGIGASNVRYLSKYNAKNDKVGRENYLALALIIYSIITCIMILVGTIMLINIENIFSESISGDNITDEGKINITKNIIISLITAEITVINLGIKYSSYEVNKALNTEKIQS